MNSIIDITKFKNIYKINILNIPNQTFSTTIENIPYNIIVTTDGNLQTFITIKERDTAICCNGNIKDMANLTTTYPKGAFFFMVDVDKQYIDLNYQNFNKGLSFYYGSF